MTLKYNFIEEDIFLLTLELPYPLENRIKLKIKPNFFQFNLKKKKFKKKKITFYGKLSNELNFEFDNKSYMKEEETVMKISHNSSFKTIIKKKNNQKS